MESAAAKSIERGATDGNLDEMVSRLSVTVDYDDFKDRQLVIEAVPEDWDLKVASLRGIEERLADDAYLASNTSSISVNALARELQRPQNFLGLHFFNPVPASTLIEVVLGEQTSEPLAQAARGWVEALGKTAVVVNDAPGFASSRLGVAIALEAMRMVEEGVASAEDIDNAMVLGYKHPTGPLRTTDIVGLDVRLGIAEYLALHAGRALRPAADPARQGGPRRTRPQDRQGLLRLDRLVRIPRCNRQKREAPDHHAITIRGTGRSPGPRSAALRSLEPSPVLTRHAAARLSR